jgi:hypothetical protein
VDKDRFVKVYAVLSQNGAGVALDSVYSAEVLAQQRIDEIQKKGENASVVAVSLNQPPRFIRN